jgi:hypothetical protein
VADCRRDDELNYSKKLDGDLVDYFVPTSDIDYGVIRDYKLRQQNRGERMVTHPDERPGPVSTPTRSMSRLSTSNPTQDPFPGRSDSVYSSQSPGPRTERGSPDSRDTRGGPDDRDTRQQILPHRETAQMQAFPTRADVEREVARRVKDNGLKEVEKREFDRVVDEAIQKLSQERNVSPGERSFLIRVVLAISNRVVNLSHTLHLSLKKGP